LNVLVINQFASCPSYNTGAGERHFYIASKLAEKGYNFIIVSGGVNHLFLKNPVTVKLFNEEKIIGGTFIWVKLRNYRPESLFGRTFSWFEFLFKLFLLPIRKYKPDAIIVSSMSLWSSIYGIHISRKLGIPFILEIRDIWPLTAIEIGKFSKNHPFIILFKLLEKYAYKIANAIISLMPSFNIHLTTTIKKTKRVYWIPNAIDKNLIITKPKEIHSKHSEKFTVVYAGALGYANAMDCFVKAANLLVDHEIEFLIIGDGPERKNLQILAGDNPKIKFINKIPKNEVLNLLTTVDAAFISWHDLKLYNYGVSANKYNDYMLASLPIISASNITDDPVLIAGCGFQVPSGDVAKISEAILALFKMSKEERRNIGRKGYEYVISHNTYDQIAIQYETCLVQTVLNYKANKMN